jgi:hypothetical protein
VREDESMNDTLERLEHSTLLTHGFAGANGISQEGS